MSQPFEKWVACWGNATSITDRKAGVYAKNLTLRYPIPICFDGGALRFHFSNLTGTEDVRLTRAYVAKSEKDSAVSRRILPESLLPILFDGREGVVLPSGAEVVSDALPFAVTQGESVTVSLYFEDYTQLNAGTLVTGPLSKGYFAYGSCADQADLPDDLTRNTNWFYFLNTVDVLTRAENRALICYGDSITAQSWPDLLTLRCLHHGYHRTSVIRRAVCGTRILRQYDCATYAAYGLKGATRFPLEMNVAGADAVILQHGINDIIHPVGTDVNRFRPWSDLPTADELRDGFLTLYARPAKQAGLTVYGGTLLPIFGWRTYAPFREELREAMNQFLLSSAELDGCVDFASAVCNPADPRAFADDCDSGDHLHPSEEGYRRMASCVNRELLK